jgi:hypothetical protein
MKAKKYKKHSAVVKATFGKGKEQQKLDMKV